MRNYRGKLTRPQSSPLVLQQRLTLDDLPMEHGVKDAQQRALSSRQERTRLKERLQTALAESECLMEYSRRRFQSVVELETHRAPPSARQTPQEFLIPHPLYHQPSPASPVPPPSCRLRSGSRPMTTDASPPQPPLTPTNGPTRNGSLLYNSVPLLLSSIRTRPKSEPPGRFDHLRGTYAHYPDIQRTLEQSNCEYRLQTTPCHTAREPGSYPHSHLDQHDADHLRHQQAFLMLVPVTSPTEADDVIAGGDLDLDPRAQRSGVKDGWRHGGQAWADELPLLASTARSRSPRSGSEESADAVQPGGERGDVALVTNGESSASYTDIPRLDLAQCSPQSTPVSSAPADSKRDESPAPSARPLVAPPSLLPVPGGGKSAGGGPPSPSGTRARPPSSHRLHASSSRPGSALSDASSVTMSAYSLSPRPHCWVDDVTVSSDESVTERDNSLQPDLADADRGSVYSGDDQGLKGSPLAGGPPTAGHVRVTSPASGTGMEAVKKKASQPLKRASSPMLKRTPSASKARQQQGGGGGGPGAAGGGGVGGGCPRSLKQSSAGSKQGGRAKSPLEGEAPLPVGTEADAEPVDPILPRFMCPSSETKSRQAAIKEWLAKTSFTTACRTVPLT